VIRTDKRRGKRTTEKGRETGAPDPNVLRKKRRGEKKVQACPLRLPRKKGIGSGEEETRKQMLPSRSFVRREGEGKKEDITSHLAPVKKSKLLQKILRPGRLSIIQCLKKKGGTASGPSTKKEKGAEEGISMPPCFR